MVQRSSIVVSNYWHKPGISVTFKHDGDSPKGSIHVELGMDDFLAALAQEMPHPLKTWTRKNQMAKIKEAYLTALEKVKESTNKVA